MDCNGNIYNIGMGCCQPVLGPIENYYTKPATDRKIEEAISGISAVTIDEVQEMIDESISGITVSGVTEEQMNEAIASAKTEIEGEIPSLDGYATEQWVEDKHYITGVDLSDYALKSEIPVVPTSNTAFTNDAGYLTEHQSLSGYATEAFVSAFTYDKATIDEKVAGGGSFDPSQYYNKTATDELLAEKLDATAYTPTDLSNYYTKSEVDNEIISAITDVEAEIPVVPTSNTAFTNDAGYLTEHQSLSGYATEQWVEDKHYITGVDLSDYATKAEIPVVPTSNTAFTNDAGYITGVDLSNYATTGDVQTAVSGKQDTLVSGTNIKTINNQSLLGSGNIDIQGGGGSYIPGRGIDITNNVISFALPISAGTGDKAIVYSYSGNTATGEYANAEGYLSRALGRTAHAEGEHTTASGDSSHAEGYSTSASCIGSHSEGNRTNAIGCASHAEGYMTIAYNESEHASGRYNVSTSASTDFGNSGNTLFSIGNGESASERHNAFEVKQNGDIYIQSGNTDIRLQDHLGGGASCTVDEKEIVENYNEIKYRNYQSKVYYKYSGTPTDNQYSYSFNIYNGSNDIYINGYVNFGTGGHTGNTSGWNTYYSVTWDNTAKRFLFATNTGYNIHSMHASNHMIYLQVPIGTVSGTPCEAASTLTDAINEVSSKAQSAVVGANLMGEGRKISQYISKNNGNSFSTEIKLKDLKVIDTKLETDINVGIGTSGWTNIDVSEACNLNDISITNFKAIYGSGIQYYYQKRITVGYEFRYTGGINYGDFIADFTNDTTLSVVLPTTGWSATYDSATSALTVTAPEGNVEYHGNVGIFTITSLGSNNCKLGNGITLQQYAENTEPIRQYVQENRTAINSKASVWCGSEADWALISGGTLDSNTIYLVY